MGRGKYDAECIREVTDQRGESLDDLHRAEASATPCMHCLLEEERRLRSLRYAAAIRRDEDLTRQARELIESIVSRGEATVVHRLWFSLLDEPVMFVIRCMTAADSDGQLLRSNNPFSFLVGEIDPRNRRRTRQAARRRLQRTKYWKSRACRSQCWVSQ